MSSHKLHTTFERPLQSANTMIRILLGNEYFLVYANLKTLNFLLQFQFARMTSFGLEHRVSVITGILHLFIYMCE